MGDPFPRWLAELESRHRASLSFAEIRRALQALSSLYVQRRSRIVEGAALESVGKRAAFALYYGPLHFMLVRQVIRALGAARPAPTRILDLGCGTGVAGAAWALEAGGSPLEGVDRNAWAVQEARWTLASLGVRGRVHQGFADRARVPGEGGGIVASFTVNEMEDGDRERMLDKLLKAARNRTRVLVMEPVARRAAPWWAEWARAFRQVGGREDTWRFPVTLPESLKLMDRAAGLDHRELTARSLWLCPSLPLAESRA
jgi:Methyltransferase domain